MFVEMTGQEYIASGTFAGLVDDLPSLKNPQRTLVPKSVQVMYRSTGEGTVPVYSVTVVVKCHRRLSLGGREVPVEESRTYDASTPDIPRDILHFVIDHKPHWYRDQVTLQLLSASV